jgi:hypothetical protein
MHTSPGPDSDWFGPGGLAAGLAALFLALVLDRSPLLPAIVIALAVAHLRAR